VPSERREVIKFAAISCGQDGEKKEREVVLDLRVDFQGGKTKKCFSTCGGLPRIIYEKGFNHLQRCY
jgi:hypothetical protein